MTTLQLHADTMPLLEKKADELAVWLAECYDRAEVRTGKNHDETKFTSSREGSSYVILELGTFYPRTPKHLLYSETPSGRIQDEDNWPSLTNTGAGTEVVCLRFTFDSEEVSVDKVVVYLGHDAYWWCANMRVPLSTDGLLDKFIEPQQEAVDLLAKQGEQ